MHYPDTLHAALWVILAVMIIWLVVSTVLVGVAQRFNGRNAGSSGPSAPLAKPMRSPTVSPRWSTELYFFLVLLGAVVVAGIDVTSAQALDAKAINAGPPGHAWCITRGGGGPAACDYDNSLVCRIAAVVTGGSCEARSSPFAVSAEVSLPRPRKLSARKPPLQKHATAATRSGNDKLFQKFVRWSSAHDAAH
jgi:hypothetical protein